MEDTKAAQFVSAFKGQFGIAPDDYSITAYDAALVIIDAVKRVAASGKPVTREAVRDAIQTSKVPTIQGTVSFDANGDLADRTVSVFQIKKDTASRSTTCRRSTSIASASAPRVLMPAPDFRPACFRRKPIQRTAAWEPYTR